jgi:hypothetical protein
MALKKNGKDGTVQIKGFSASSSSAGALVTLCVKKWEASLKKDEHDTSSTCNTDWHEFQTGKKVVEFSIEAQLDGSLFDTTVDTDADYAAVKLGYESTVAFDMPKAILTEIKITSAENDIITYSITGKSSGTVTLG